MKTVHHHRAVDADADADVDVDAHLQLRTPLDCPEIDRAWDEAARALGFHLRRTDAAYASSDGAGALLIGRRETLDADDSLAQLVFHEICHALVQGDASWKVPDWGLDNTEGDGRLDAREEACLRLQAHLADKVGLRALMAPTTEWRDYYLRLPEDALEACAPARAGAERALRAPVWDALEGALAITAAAVRPATRQTLQQSQTLHISGFAFGPANETCGSCAWSYKGGPGPPVDRCRQSADTDGQTKRIDLALAACERWEPSVSCDSCGACCREAYHVVSVAMRDPVVWRHPDLIVRNGHRFSVRRDGERCAALEVTGAIPYRCGIYEDRPRTCRDFERGGRHCLVARRRVGLSP